MSEALSHARLLALLHYDPETGLFVWRLRCGRQSAGDPAGFAQSRGYRYVSVDRRTYGAHRLAWFYMTGEWPPNDVDHINRDRGDNRWTNLRAATRSQNNANMRVRSAHGFKGATFNKRQGRWLAQTKIDGKQVYLGYYDTGEEAHAAYLAAAKRQWGEFARPS